MDAGFGPVSLPAEQTHPALGAVRGGDLPAHLIRLGRRPETLEAVLASHAHADHIGWTAWPGPLGELPVLMTEREWQAARPSEAVTAELLDAVRPRVRTVRDGEEVFPGVSVLALPGHTLGHAGLRIESAGERLLVLGDALLTALQVAHPDWTKLGDESAAEATRTRDRLLRELADTGTPAYAGHFDGANFGRVERRGDAYRWLPLS
jgi:glyoxylase-like metal-dependent hydrolase (beta-lactamase superfamily II)